jgi:hypothetical protein
MVVAQVSRLNTAGHETIRVEATAAAGVQRVPGHRHHRRAAPRRPSAAASSDFYARKPPPGRPGRRTCFPDPFCDLFLTRVGLRLTEADHVDRSSATAPETAAGIVTVSPTANPGVGYVMLDGHRNPAASEPPRHSTRRSAGSRPLTRRLPTRVRAARVRNGPAQGVSDTNHPPVHFQAGIVTVVPPTMQESAHSTKASRRPVRVSSRDWRRPWL